MSTYADANDVAARWGKDPESLDAPLTTLINTRLADAERMLKRRISDLDTRAEDDDYLAEVIRVESEAVLRLARNPEGYLSEGDGNYQYMLLQEISSGKLEILPDEWDALGVTNEGMFIIAPFPVVGS
ncbi:Gp19/Gp15/Gp42 family protein [Mycobacterium intracellulare]|uniref:Head-to-tail adaptor n=1 Tax=Mycobacterium intracellulare TaxID=1767 RepID=A0A7R7MYX1_MYCIT|nr:Gp19/Gp15/Gp42 family protein [Mycobacterium intracellulare]BCP02519.1 hypothetical protein MINTM018_52880 [Mycobacterium intracellulare]BCP36369.1 hypothetical protein MINTMi198_17390 [Mycobacterium intracellulare M.i.198]